MARLIWLKASERKVSMIRKPSGGARLMNLVNKAEENKIKEEVIAEVREALDVAMKSLKVDSQDQISRTLSKSTNQIQESIREAVDQTQRDLKREIDHSGQDYSVRYQAVKSKEQALLSKRDEILGYLTHIS